MPDLNSWAGNTFPLADWSDDYDPGVDTARIVGDKTTSITVVRAGVAQDAQTVRIEELRREREVETPGGQTALVQVVVIGYKGHPSISDTDLQRGDKFAVAGVSYEIVALVPGLADSLQAYAKVRS